MPRRLKRLEREAKYGTPGEWIFVLGLGIIVVTILLAFS